VRASELIGTTVRATDGRVLGRIVELHAVLDGPLRGGLSAPRIHEVSIARTQIGAALGYQHHPEQGPWAVRRVMGAILGRPLRVPWRHLRPGEDGLVLAGDLRSDLD